MTDIIERLRASADEVAEFPHPSQCDHLHDATAVMHAAADEIEQLRAALDFIATHQDSEWPERCRLNVEAARAALKP